MILLFALVLLLHSSNGEIINKVRSHLSENLKIKCEALPHRTSFVGNKCYFAVFTQVVYKDAFAQCSSALKDSQVALDAAGIYTTLMVDPSKFHHNAKSSDGKYTLCVYDSGYKCGAGQSMNRGKCIARAEKKATFSEAQRNCKRLGLELSSITNDFDNQIVAGEVAKDAAWVQNALVKRSNKFMWTSEKAFARYSACERKSASCNGPMSSVIEKTGYWSNAEQQQVMAAVCMKNAENEFTPVAPVKKVSIEGDERCVENHEMDESTGQCEWTGPIDACVLLIDYWNRTWFVSMDNFPTFVHTEECLERSRNVLDNHVVKVVVRRGCMFTGYQYSYPIAGGAPEDKVGQNLIYGAHRLPNFYTKDFPMPVNGLTRANCFCDPTEATVNGHVPSPPADRKCVEHHVFNETTQQCEWTKDLKYCGELHTSNNQRMLLEMPNWPSNRKYDVNHKAAQSQFQLTVSHIVVRQHCFATLYWSNDIQHYETMPTHGYGHHQVINTQTGNGGHGTARVVCECIK